MEVLRLPTHGRTNHEAVEELVVGPETVKTHVGIFLAKLHLVHRAQAVVHALKQDLTSLDEIELQPPPLKGDPIPGPHSQALIRHIINNFTRATRPI